MVSHDPPSTSPAMMRKSPTRARVPSGLPGLLTTGAMNSGIPTTIGSTRHQPGGRGVVRRLTPSGLIHTRRSETRELAVASSGTSTIMPRYPHSVGVTV